MEIKIARDFTTAPGPRKISEGKFSGELFRKKILAPKVREAIEQSVSLSIDLDGTSGYGTSFLEESFGGLIRNDGYSLAELKHVLTFKSNEEPALLDEIEEYMADAEERRTSGR